MGILGAKTIRLKELKELGFNVPKFTAIDNEAILSGDFAILAKRAHDELKCESYAVRSSALIEDSENQSFAGQFETQLNIKPQELAKAIKAVAQQAKGLLKGDLSKFSIIIQQFINPDFSGVTFTRNPLGGRDMVVEYHKGVGEDLVSGRIKPQKKEFYWHQADLPLPEAETAIQAFQEIEKHYKFPQDIEWCIKGDEWFFLQTRPITTIDKREYEKSLYLDKILPKDKKFYYEKTEISEIAPRPTQITKGLLDHIYSKSGPIQKVYEKYGVKYEQRDTLRIIGNELFVDREEELKTLLPAYSFLNNDDLKPKLARFQGLLRTIKNSFKLNKVDLEKYKEITKDLQSALGKEESYDKDFLKDFMRDYEMVFEINFLTSYAFKRLEIALQKDKDKMAEILTGDIGIPDTKLEMRFDGSHLKGNALGILDESVFIRNENKSHSSAALEDWWSNLSSVKKQILGKPIKYAILYNQLREFGRWIVVKNINNLREMLFSLAEKQHFEKKDLIYFAKLEEIISGTLSEERFKKRKGEYDAFNDWTLPNKLTYKPIKKEEELLAVSAGEVEGILTDVKSLKTDGTSQILYTENLEPSLTKYFGQIGGIVSQNGSMLSHLAIVAREEGLPVVVNFSLQESGLKLGDKIKIQNNPTDVLTC